MKDLLRFITCGSVDDGKSTLIGHILYASKLLYADQEKALALESKIGSRGGELDYSLLLDGLTEEREQGITIDVAYRYFTTDVRSFIVADTPGHEEYTRNMAVGASNADLAVILIDAQQGVLLQTKRHARICEIMGIRHFVFAVNKMDLVNYEEEIFNDVLEEINKLQKELNLQNIKVIPVSATEGDNVADISENMKWYKGETLLSHLENVEIKNDKEEKGFYLPVQRVCRPDYSFRGFQGQIENGQIFVGDEITVLPTREKAHVKKIFIGSREQEKAFAGQAVTLQLDREIDVSRGSVIEKKSGLETADAITATLIWLDDTPLNNGGNFFVKTGTNLIPCIVAKILYIIDVNTGAFREAKSAEKNEIAVCRISFTDRITIDRFNRHKTMGELILIDRVTFMTSACGVVEQYDKNGGIAENRISAKTRSAAMGQQAVTVIFRSEDGFTLEKLENAEKKLILGGRHTYLLEAEKNDVWKIIGHLNKAGLVVLLLAENDAVSQASNNEIRAIIYSKKKKDEDSVVEFVKNVSSYDYDISEGALYI